MNRSTDTFAPTARRTWHGAAAWLSAWRRLRWRQRLIRLVGVAAAVLIVAYAALPWWLPTGAVKQWLAEEMARQMGVEVAIAEMSVGWGKGVQIRGLTVAPPAGFGEEPMLTVEQIHTEFAPLRYLIGRRIESIEVDRPRLLVIVRPDGASNVAPLRQLQFDVAAKHISIRGAEAALDLPGRDSRRQLNVTSFQFDAGRRRKIGTVTLSAELQQPDGVAPIELTVEPGGDPSVAARATLSFTNVDLDQLSLSALLHLPISKSGGLCSGSIKLQVNRRSVVDRFALHLSVVGLDVQPVQGPELPIIDRADLDITAAYDPLAPDGLLQIHSMRVHLPDALELTGRAVVHTDVLGANWQAIESLQLNGRLSPSRLAQIFTGRRGLGNSDVIITGPVELDISARRTRANLHIRVDIDATAAAISRGPDVLKPAGRVLAGELAGTFNEQSDVFNIHRNCYVELGGNRVWGFGAVPNARQHVDRLLAGEAGLQLHQVAESIAAADSTGVVELADGQAIRDLLPQLAPALAELTLDGPVVANWSVFERAGRRIELHVLVPAETQLAVGEWFGKPAGQATTLTFAAAIDTAEGTLEDIDIDFTCGDGRLGVDNGWAIFARGGRQPAGPVKLAGSFTAEQFQAIAACFPPLAARAADMRSQFRGQYHATYDPPTGCWQAEADLRDLRVVWGTEANKFDRDPHLPARHGQPGRAGRHGLPGLWSLQGGRVSGDLFIGIERTGDGVLTISLNGDDLEARAVVNDLTRHKRAGTRLRGKVTIRPTDPTGATQADALAVDLAFGDSELTVVQPAGATSDDVRQPYRAMLVVDDALLALLPELAEPVRAIDLGGKVRVTGELCLRADGADLTADIDAGDLAFRLDGRLGKPRGATMEMLLQVSIAEDGSVAATIERGLLGRVGVTGQVNILCQQGPDGRPAHRASSGQLLLATEHAESLGEFAPELVDHLLTGTGRVELQWTADARSADIRAQAAIDEVIYRHNGKDARLAGELAGVVSIRPRRQDPATEGGRPARQGRYVVVESVRTEGLEFLIDDYHGFIVADLVDLPDRATGSIHLLADKLDSKALGDWLGGGDTQPQPETSTLSEAETSLLDRRAMEVIDTIRPYLQNGKVRLQASVDEFRTYDEAVGQSYVLRNLAASCTVDHGYIMLEYAAGLNSGTLRRRYQAHLGDEAPMVRYEGELIDVIARENIRPQIALSFPGNTVTGFFNRRESLEMTLRAVIANSIDWRYPLQPTGHAKTVAIEGLTKGQAAPKFITGIFPGLNTARYEYKKMTAFADYAEDGLVINDMVFDGHAYDLYMDGTTDAENIGRYEIGVILLGRPQSPEWNHTYRQGRIPIVKFEGRIEGGELHDVTVSYPWPNETFYTIFMKNNYLYRVWLERKRRQQTD